MRLVLNCHVKLCSQGKLTSSILYVFLWWEVHTHRETIWNKQSYSFKSYPAWARVLKSATLSPNEQACTHSIPGGAPNACLFFSIRFIIFPSFTWKWAEHSSALQFTFCIPHCNATWLFHLQEFAFNQKIYTLWQKKIEVGHVSFLSAAIQANTLNCLHWAMHWIIVCMHSVPCAINMPTCIED